MVLYGHGGYPSQFCLRYGTQQHRFPQKANYYYIHYYGLLICVKYKSSLLEVKLEENIKTKMGKYKYKKIFF